MKQNKLHKYTSKIQKAPALLERQRYFYPLVMYKSKAYSIWLYYHKVTHDTLFVIMKDYIAPKINLKNSKLLEMKGNLSGMTEGHQKRSLEKDIAAEEEFINELKEFHKTIKQIADGGYDPDIDDGAILNIAPLHKVVPWKEPEKYWKDLQKGKYDWAHIAMKYWPERVKEKCKKDKSLSVAHDIRV